MGKVIPHSFFTDFDIDLFKIGIGPSSSHTVGPMLAALEMSKAAASGITVELFGSLALTGDGHGTDRAIMLGLSGHHPETVPLELVWALPDTVRQTRRLTTADGAEIDFDPDRFWSWVSLRAAAETRASRGTEPRARQAARAIERNTMRGACYKDSVK